MQEDFKSLKPEQLEALKQLLGEAYNVQLPDVSDWFDGKQIDEIAFGEYMLQKKERKCIHGKLYDENLMAAFKWITKKGCEKQEYAAGWKILPAVFFSLKWYNTEL